MDDIDASGFVDRVQIDLRQGHFSSIGKYTGGNNVWFDNEGQEAFATADNDDHGNISIAYFTVIEKMLQALMMFWVIY